MTNFVSWIAILLCCYTYDVNALRFPRRWPFEPGLVDIGQNDDSAVPPAPWSRATYSEGRGDRLGFRYAPAPIEGREDEFLSDPHPEGHISTRVNVPSQVRELEREDLIDKSAHRPFRPVSETTHNLESQQTKKSPSPAEIQQNPQKAALAQSDQSSPFADALRDTSQRQDEVTEKKSHLGDIYFVALVAGCSAAAIFGVIGAGYCFYKVQKNSRAAADVDYPAYGVTGPSKESTSPTADRKLAQSAQMYHFQHQKQQMIAVEKNHTNRHTSASDVDTEEENEEGDYTVYECPGLAPTGEMEVKNPLFNDDQTPVSPPVPVTKEEKKKTP